MLIGKELLCRKFPAHFQGFRAATEEEENLKRRQRQQRGPGTGWLHVSFAFAYFPADALSVFGIHTLSRGSIAQQISRALWLVRFSGSRDLGKSPKISGLFPSASDSDCHPNRGSIKDWYRECIDIQPECYLHWQNQGWPD
jgi:hypothetical protein